MHKRATHKVKQNKNRMEKTKTGWTIHTPYPNHALIYRFPATSAPGSLRGRLDLTGLAANTHMGAWVLMYLAPVEQKLSLGDRP